jgi:hypothetical protein
VSLFALNIVPISDADCDAHRVRNVDIPAGGAPVRAVASLTLPRPPAAGSRSGDSA